MVESASAKPSARRMAACRAPSASRIAACFAPSATRMAEAFLPSASVTDARRVRSAVSCRFMASCTSRGGVSSLISTLVTFTPHRWVISSSFTLSDSLISSRLARTSSSGMLPITARRVVCAMPWMA